MSKKWIYTDENRGGKIIDLIRELGGIVFVDPCPRSPIADRIDDVIMKVFK